MEREPEPFAWNFCPICGDATTIDNDGQSEKPHCAGCGHFFYRNPVPAACCLVSRDDELLFVQRAVKPFRGLWSLPGGFVELGETAEEAVLRELEEETGLTGTGTTLIGAKTTPSSTAGAVLLLGYIIGTWEGQLRPGSDAMDVGFFKKDARPPLAFQAHRDLITIYDAMMAGTHKP